MGYEDRDYYRDDAAESTGFSMPTEISWSMRLIIINGIVFLLNLISEGHLAKGGQVGGIELPGLAFTGATLAKPWLWWQYFTAGFVHPTASIFPIIWNMISLFFFGPRLEDVYGKREFLAFYLVVQTITSLSLGVLLFASGFNAPIVIGAAFVTTAVVLLFCFHFPYATIMFFAVIPVPAWLYGAFTIVGILMSQMGSFSGTGSAALLSMLGPGMLTLGLTVGYFYYQVRIMDWLPDSWSDGSRGYQDAASESWSDSQRRPASRSAGTGWWNPFKWWRKSQTRKNLNVVRDDDGPTERDEDDELEAAGDRLLEKLHRDGEASLSPTERATLKRYSELMRGKKR